MKQSIKCLAIGTGFLTIAALTVTGHLAQVIPFAGPLNELGFFIISGLMGCLYIFAGFSKESITTKESTR